MGQKYKRETAFEGPHGSMEFSAEQGLMPWLEVRNRWNAMSGERISRARVWQIGLRAEAKLRDKLADLAGYSLAADGDREMRLGVDESLGLTGEYSGLR